MGGKDILLSASKCSSNIDLRGSGLKLMIDGLISILCLICVCLSANGTKEILGKAGHGHIPQESVAK